MKLQQTPRRSVPSVGLALALGVSSCSGGGVGRDEFGDPGPPSLARSGSGGTSASGDAASGAGPGPGGLTGGVDVDSGNGPAVRADGGAADSAGTRSDSGRIDGAADAAGGGAGGGGSNGGGGGTTTGGSDGAVVVDASGPPDVCPAADAAQTATCVPSLVANPTFDRDSVGWTSDGFASQLFDATKDFRGNLASGSLQITNANFDASHDGLVMAGSFQCLAASAGASYDLSVEAFLSPGPVPRGVALGLRFFPTTSCTGQTTGAFVTPPAGVPDKWSVVRLLAAAPAGTQSLSVHLLVEKNYQQSNAVASFDNVLLRPF